jgi:hypothetical protein
MWKNLFVRKTENYTRPKFQNNPIFNEVGPDTALRIAQAVTEASERKIPAINVFITSGGGSVQHAIASYNLLMLARAKGIRVNTLNIGEVSSAAILIYSAGEERICAPNASFYFHPMSGDRIDGIMKRWRDGDPHRGFLPLLDDEREHLGALFSEGQSYSDAYFTQIAVALNRAPTDILGIVNANRNTGRTIYSPEAVTLGIATTIQKDINF